MKTCDIVTDLLPLYYDEVCNESSKNLVEEHLLGCGACQTLFVKIKDNTLEDQIQTERANIIGQHQQSVRKKYLMTVSVMLLIPIVVTFIVNLSTARTLSWFFIVLTALSVVGSMVLVPLIVEKERGLWTLMSFIGSLFLMLITIDVFTGGRSWSMIPISAVLFGGSVIFAPFVLSRFTLKGSLNNHKGLVAMTLNTVLLFGMLTVIGLHVQAANYWRNAFLIASFCITLPWATFLTARYLETNVFIKTGLCFIYTAGFLVMINSVIAWILYSVWNNPLRFSNLFAGEGIVIDNTNLHLLWLVLGCAIGGVLLIIGVLQVKKNKWD